MVSYSNRYGEINNMIAPVRSMIGDTLVLSIYWSNYNYDVSIEKYGIVLDWGNNMNTIYTLVLIVYHYIKLYGWTLDEFWELLVFISR